MTVRCIKWYDAEPRPPTLAPRLDRPPTRADWDAVAGTAAALRDAGVMPADQESRPAERVRRYAVAGEG